MSVIAQPVPLEELIAMFTGVPDHNGQWATTPVYSIPLALEIARRTDPTTLAELRERLYDTTPAELIPEAAREAIQIASQRYQYLRNTRGL